MRTIIGVAAVILLASNLMAAPPDGPNLAVPDTLEAGKWCLQSDFRFFEGDNTTSSFKLTYGTADNSETSLGFVTFDNTGPDPIAGALRRSELDMLTFSYRLIGQEAEGSRWGIGGQFDLEIPFTWRGTNLATGARAETDDSILAISLLLDHRACDKLALRTQPKLVFFRDTIPDSLGGDTKSFGTVLAVTSGGTLELSDRWWLFADWTNVWAGDNAISQRSGLPADRTLWTAGARLQSPDGTKWIELYMTNAAGLSTATSVIGAPEDEAISLRAGIAF
jgi:hypothetical protein